MSGIIQNMDSSNGQNGSFISFPHPITGEEIHRQLFEVVHRFGFKPNDEIYLYFISDQYNFRLFFNNFSGHSDGTIPIGSYPYREFCEKNKEESLKFALEIFDEIEKIKKEELKNERG